MPRRKRNQSPISLFSFQDIITSVTGIMILTTLMLAVEVIQKAPDSKTREIAHDMRESAQDIREQVTRIQGEADKVRRQLETNRTTMLGGAGVDPVELERQRKDLSEASSMLEKQLQGSSQQREEAEKRAADAKAAERAHANDQRTIEQLIQSAHDKARRLEKLKQSGRIIFSLPQSGGKTPWLVEIDGSKMRVAQSGKTSPPQVFNDTASFIAWAQQRQRNSEYFVLLIKPDGIETFRQTYAALQSLRFDVGYDLVPQGQTVLDAEKGGGY